MAVRQYQEGQVGRREDNRNEKRALIIQAAQTLMQQGEQEGFSMRRLAETAGVSIATPYNLFGSKEALVAEVMDRDLADFREQLQARQGDGLDQFFNVITVVVDLARQNPGYYRTGALTLNAETDPALTTHFGTTRHAFLRDLVSRGVQEGFIVPRVNPDSFAIHLGQLFYGWIQLWAKNQISLDQLTARASYGFAMSLAAVVTEPFRERMQQLIVHHQELMPEAPQQHEVRASAG